MSTSNLYRVYRTKATALAEYRNGHGTAPVIWGHLCKRFLGRESHSWLFNQDGALWKLVTDPQVPRPYRLVHAFCCDHAVCPPDRVEDLADACDEIYRATHKPQYVNHWAAVAMQLRSHKRKSREIGVALSPTSVQDEWISWRGDPKPFDIFAYVDGTSQPLLATQAAQ